LRLRGDALGDHGDELHLSTSSICSPHRCRKTPHQWAHPRGRRRRCSRYLCRARESRWRRDRGYQLQESLFGEQTLVSAEGRMMHDTLHRHKTSRILQRLPIGPSHSLLESQRSVPFNPSGRTLANGRQGVAQFGVRPADPDGPLDRARTVSGLTTTGTMPGRKNSTEPERRRLLRTSQTLESSGRGTAQAGGGGLPIACRAESCTRGAPRPRGHSDGRQLVATLEEQHVERLRRGNKDSRRVLLASVVLFAIVERLP